MVSGQSTKPCRGRFLVLFRWGAHMELDDSTAICVGVGGSQSFLKLGSQLLSNYAMQNDVDTNDSILLLQALEDVLCLVL